LRYRSISLLAAGHLFADLNQGALPALLPFFIIEHHLSYAAAASIVFASNIASSVVQPILGYFSDRLEKIWLMPLGIFLAGFGLALTGLTDKFPLILAAAAVSGLGTAAFHPEAARLVNKLALNNKASGLGMFSSGGSAGYAIGPLIATGVVLSFGLGGTLVFALPATIMAIFLYFKFRNISLPDEKPATANSAEAMQNQWFAFLRLSGVVIARSILFFGFNTFIPLYWILVLHQSTVAGSTALTILFSCGIFATMLGGRLADKFGYRKILIAGFGLMLPVIAIFPHVHNPVLATILLIPLSMGLFGIYGPMIASGQNYLPSRVGFASGITIGLAVTIGGVAAPLLGRIADLYGIPIAFESLIVIPPVAILLAATLPATRR